ncbi:MAG: hypothetical protein FJ358_00550 [Thaumarchaeota archaeon]|nr:hypothetical protein [Nitrososphaerota archaeon]
MHKYRRRYLLIGLDGKNIQDTFQASPLKVKIIKAEGGYAVLKTDSHTVDSLKTFVKEKGFKTISTSGTIKGLSRKSKRLNLSS